MIERHKRILTKFNTELENEEKLLITSEHLFMKEIYKLPNFTHPDISRNDSILICEYGKQGIYIY